MGEYSIKDKVAIVGLGETKYYKRGQAPVSEFQLALRGDSQGGRGRRHRSHATSTASPPTATTATTLHASRPRSACRHYALANMVWGGGGGGGSGAVAQAAAAVAAGYAKYVVVFRALAQGQFGRFGQAAAGRDRLRRRPHTRGPTGCSFPRRWSRCACAASCTSIASPRTRCAAMALAVLPSCATQPARRDVWPPADPRAVRPSRWIVEPFHLFDCCHGERRRRRADPDQRRARARPQAEAGLRDGGGAGSRLIARPPRPTIRPTTPPRISERSRRGCTRWPRSAHRTSTWCRCYENFTGGVLMSLVEHGFCEPDGVTNSAGWRTSWRRTASCRSTPAAATWPSATCTGSSWSTKRCASAAEARPRRCPTRRSRWWRRARWSRR